MIRSNSRLHVDEILFKEQRKIVQNLIKSKKQMYYNDKLKNNIGKPKELWKTLKTMGFPNKSSSPSNTCLKKDGVTYFDNKNNAEIFKDFFVI